MRPANSVRWTSWAALTLFVVFVALPGRSRSPFSGIPFSSQAHAVVAAFLLGLQMIWLITKHRYKQASQPLPTEQPVHVPVVESA